MTSTNPDRSGSSRAQVSAASGRRRIVVAMSGGVDSAVAAALLKAEGHDVIGVTLQLYDHGQATARKRSCCAGQDIYDARRAAEIIGIPHYVLDYEKRFDEAVIQTFADSYLAGETPIPCVTCNAQVKFHDLLATARDLGADLMATGHYIAREEGPTGPQLRRAADGDRDQSYFLFNTTRAQLEQLCFPLAEMLKPEVRKIAGELGLQVADKPDSQDICFVPAGRYTDVVTRLRPQAGEPGDIVHVDGRVLGRHGGVVGFTIGQRRGLGVNSLEPLFVIRIEPDAKRIVVGPREHLRTTTVALKEVNWLGDEFDAHVPHSIDIYVKLRSQQAPRPATVHFLGDGRAMVDLANPEYGISAGQACVFYADGSERALLLGGGWIRRPPDVPRHTAEMAGVTAGAGR